MKIKPSDSKNMGQNTDLQMFPDCCDDGAIPALQLIGLKLPCLVFGNIYINATTLISRGTIKP